MPERRLLAALTQQLIELLGIPFGVFLGSYTGVLLAATSNPLWSRPQYHAGDGPQVLPLDVLSRTWWHPF